MADWANKLARFFAPHGRNPGLGYWQIGLFVCLFVFSFCWWEFPWWLREPAFNAVDPGSVPGEGSPGEGSGYPLQYSCLGNPMARGARQALVRHDWATSRERATWEKENSFCLIPRFCRRCNCLLGCALFSVVSVTQSCGTVSHPMDCNLPGSSVCGYSRPEYCSEFPFPCPGTLPNPEIKPESPALQANCLPCEPPLFFF